MKKILLIETPFKFFQKIAGMYFPNPGLLTIASFLEKNKYNVKIIDMPALNLRLKDIPSIINKEKPDIVGISGLTANSYVCMALAEIVKETNPYIITIFGGTHFSLMPEESLRLSKCIDYIVVGEGEITILELIQAIEKGLKKKDMIDIKGLAYLEENNFIKTPERALIEDLDDLPMAPYHLLPMDKYAVPLLGKSGFGCTFSRGCSYKCNFCSEQVLWRSRWRGRSAKKIVEELKLLNKVYKKRVFWIGDNNFFHNRIRNNEFLEELEKSNLDIKFWAQGRVNHLIRDRDLLLRFQKMGLTIIMVGIENYSQRVLSEWNKDQSVENIIEMAFYIHKAKIPIFMACLIWGNYNDDRKEIISLLNKSRKMGVDFIAHALLTPLPGTLLFEEMKEKNRIMVWDYRRYDFDHAIMPTAYLSIRGLEFLTIYIFLKWWFNPVRLFINILDKQRRRLHFYQFNLVLKAIYLILFKILFNKSIYEDSPIIDRIYKRHLEFIGKEGEKQIESIKGWR